MEEVLVAKAVSWKTELTSMMSSATSETDKQALAAFQSALMPYLDTPDSLRTLLGKIQMASTLETLTARAKFSSLAEFQSTLPDTVKVIAA